MPTLQDPRTRFGAEYFRRYAGSGRSYDRVWRDHSYAPELVQQFKHPAAPRLRRICMLGMATGKIGLFLERGMKCKVWGCELSPWAHARIPQPLRRRTRRQDMRDYIAERRRRGERFDLS